MNMITSLFPWRPKWSQMKSTDQDDNWVYLVCQLRSTGNGFLQWYVEKGSEAVPKVQ